MQYPVPNTFGLRRRHLLVEHGCNDQQYQCDLGWKLFLDRNRPECLYGIGTSTGLGQFHDSKPNDFPYKCRRFLRPTERYAYCCWGKQFRVEQWRVNAFDYRKCPRILFRNGNCSEWLYRLNYYCGCQPVEPARRDNHRHQQRPDLRSTQCHIKRHGRRQLQLEHRSRYVIDYGCAKRYLHRNYHQCKWLYGHCRNEYFC